MRSPRSQAGGSQRWGGMDRDGILRSSLLNGKEEGCRGAADRFSARSWRSESLPSLFLWGYAAWVQTLTPSSVGPSPGLLSLPPGALGCPALYPPPQLQKSMRVMYVATRPVPSR